MDKYNDDAVVDGNEDKYNEDQVVEPEDNFDSFIQSLPSGNEPQLEEEKVESSKRTNSFMHSQQSGILDSGKISSKKSSSIKMSI